MTGRVFCHIGNPKACSTSIQQWLLSQDEITLDYIGFRPDADHRRWYSSDTESRLFNLDLRLANARAFARHEAYYRAWLAERADQAARAGRDLWLSSENLSTRFVLGDLPTETKFQRLARIMPPETVYVVVFRPLLASLRSIYSEYVKQGYGHSLSHFAEETYLLRDANFLDALMPGRALQTMVDELAAPERISGCFLPATSSRTGEHLGVFLSTITGNASAELPHAYKGSDGWETSALLAALQTTPAPADATGLLETHRTLWHLSDQERERFDGVIWSKLRHLRALRDRLDPPGDQAEAQHKLAETPLWQWLLEARADDQALFSALETAGVKIGGDYGAIWK